MRFLARARPAPHVVAPVSSLAAGRGRLAAVARRAMQRGRARTAVAAAGPRSGDGAPRPAPARAADLPPSVWSLKPVWCQPWSIIGTGAAAVAAAAELGGPFWGTAGATLVGAWWWLFLVAYPKQYSEYREAAARGDEGGEA